MQRSIGTTVFPNSQEIFRRTNHQDIHRPFCKTKIFWELDRKNNFFYYAVHQKSIGRKKSFSYKRNSDSFCTEHKGLLVLSTNSKRPSWCSGRVQPNSQTADNLKTQKSRKLLSFNITILQRSRIWKKVKDLLLLKSFLTV